jgi:N-formylglutamate amidohydrolase
MPDSERNSIIAELTPPFVVSRPARQYSPIVFCSPHSGRVYPSAFLAASKLDAQTLRRSEDCYVDELFEAVTRYGAPLIAARFPRAYLDVNREPYELDPELFDDALPEYANSQTMRVVGGLGTIARIVSDTEEIYDRKLPLAVAHERIERLYKPFHAELKSLLDETREAFGYAMLVDCHSMPSSSSNYPAAARPEFVIGDRFGTSCDMRITRMVRDILSGLGRQVQLNRPYAGGFITEYYGQPDAGIHALQIEINRGLYLDEFRLKRSRGFGNLRDMIEAFCQQLTIRLPPALELRDAAE